MNLPMELLLQCPLFNWMGQGDLEMLANCFDMEWETLAAGASVQSRGRLGYVLSGTGTRRCGGIASAFSQGQLLGLLPDRDGQPVDETVTAAEPCQLVWLDGDVMVSVCYRACWFHGRFVTEVRRRLSPPPSCEDGAVQKGGFEI